MEKLLTIVVPVYKVEKYINKCLDSLIIPSNQREKVEVIVINDGTPDRSAIMAKEYEKRYPEYFKVIDQENGGHGAAWNAGVELATGKYLRFLDSDDWLTNLSEFVDKLEGFDVDMVFTDLQIVNEHDETLNHLYRGAVAMETNHIYQVDDYDWKKTDTMYDGHNITNFHMCTYRTEMLRKYHPVFFGKMYYDDEILHVLPLCSSKSFVYFNLTLYNYLKGREGQTMDPSIMLRNIGFKIIIRKHITDFYIKHPVGVVSVNRKLQFIINSKNFDTFKLMALLPYKDSINQMKELRLWLNQNYSDYDGGTPDKIYQTSPFVFWLIYHFLRPIWKRYKQNIKK